MPSSDHMGPCEDLSWGIMCSWYGFSDSSDIFGKLNKAKLLDESDLSGRTFMGYISVNTPEPISNMQLKTDSSVLWRFLIYFYTGFLAKKSLQDEQAD